MNREVRALPDVMITSTASTLAFLPYFSCWCHIMNNLPVLPLTVWSLQENLKPLPTVLTRTQFIISCNDLTLGYQIVNINS